MYESINWALYCHHFLADAESSKYGTTELEH